MAITTMDGLIAAMPGQVLPFYKPAVTTKGAGFWHSLWQAAGTPAAGATPATGAGTVATSATVGAIKFSDPTGGPLTYLSRLMAHSGVVGSLTLYDRLCHTSGLSGTVATAQTVNTAALTRSTTGENVEAFIEWYTATGASAVNVTANYVNQLGSTGQVGPSQAFMQSPVAGQMQAIALNGDGCRRIESITLSATTGTAGNFGITLMKRLVTVPMAQANTGVILDAFAAGMAQVSDSACLALMVFCSSTTQGPVFGELGLSQG